MITGTFDSVSSSVHAQEGLTGRSADVIEKFKKSLRDVDWTDKESTAAGRNVPPQPWGVR